MHKRPGPGRRIAVLAVALGLVGSMTQRTAPQAVAFGSGDVTPPAPFYAAQWTGPITPVHEILLLWDDILDETSVPDPTDFTVDLDTVPLVVDGVSFTHAGFVDPGTAVTFMTVHLEDPVTVGGILELSYAPGAIPVLDEAGNAAVDFGPLSVEIFAYESFGAVMALVDGSYARDHVGVLFADAVDPSTIPAASAFKVTRNDGLPMDATSISIYPGFGGRLLDLGLPQGFRSGDVAEITYAAPGGGGIKNVAGTAAPDFAAAAVLLFLQAQDSAIGTVGPGGSVSTDVGDLGTTAQDPVATTIMVPAGATVAIDEGATLLPPPTTEWTFIGETVEIGVDPPGTAGDPIAIEFAIDASVLAAFGVTPAGVEVFRNGVLVDDPCTGPVGEASPDPCVASKTAVPAAPDPLDYAVIRVLSSHASTWTLAIPTPFAFSGFFGPVDNPPVENLVAAGRAIPVIFSLGGDRGLDVFEPGSPSSVGVDCTSGAPIDLIEQTVTAGTSSLSYDSVTDQYTYIWKTAKAWAGCRNLTLGFTDGSSATAMFRFR